MKKIKYIAALTAILVVGALIGVAGAILSYERVTMVDYEGGGIREVIRVGPLTLHEIDFPMTAFQLIPLKSGTSISPDHDWHVAHRFGAWSQVSPSTKGGEVLSVMTDLASVTHTIGMDKASEIKTQFVTDLRSQDPNDAAEAAKQDILHAVDNAIAAGN